MLHHCRHILPMRICGVHLVIRSCIIELALPYILHALGKDLRARFRAHSEFDAPVLEGLKEYGISSNLIPREIGGTFDQDLDDWVASRRLKEQVPGHANQSRRSRTPPPIDDVRHRKLSRAA